MTRILPLLFVLLPVSCGRGASETETQARLVYPATRTIDHVDSYHGTEVPDPYRWLEDDNAEETKAWVKAQNELTFGYLRGLESRAAIRERIEELLDYEKYGVPFTEGGRYFFKINDGLQNQFVLYVADSLDGEKRVLLDPNKLSEDGTVALRRQWVSRDGKLMAYALSEGGSDWRTIKVMDVDTGRDLAADVLTNVKFGGCSWMPDSSGFYYSRFPAPKPGEELTAANLLQKIYFHRIGTPQSEDMLVYERPDNPRLGVYGGVTRDGRYLLIYVSRGSSRKAAVYYKELEGGGKIQTLFDSFEDANSFLGNNGTTFYFLTDRGAPKRRIVSLDLSDPRPEAWTELVPETKNVIESASIIGGHFVIEYLEHAHSSVVLRRLDGAQAEKIELPALGSIWGLSGEQDQMEMFFSFSSYTYPSTILRYDFAKGELEVVQRPEVDFDPDDFVVKQVAYKNPDDGQYITMFIAHEKRRRFKLDGSHPTLLTGYGGFGQTTTPWFSVSRLVWMEMGGVIAAPNLRGGGEYGEKWHEAGMRERKQTVFDDFIAAAEALIANGYTSRSKLAIAGGSNGGLLVGACMTQRPDLFAACLPAVGLMDMLRYHKFTVGRAWVVEYGSSDDADMFKVLRAYSPYHNLKKGTRYPATLVTTGDHDDRVVPAHSFKYAARLQACQAGDAPVLIRIETSGGHGGGTPTSKVLDSAADRYAFLAHVLRME